MSTRVQSFKMPPASPASARPTPGWAKLAADARAMRADAAEVEALRRRAEAEVDVAVVAFAGPNAAVAVDGELGIRGYAARQDERGRLRDQRVAHAHAHRGHADSGGAER